MVERIAVTTPHTAEPFDRSHKVVALVAALIDEGIEERASDIHLDPVPEGLRVRMRIDGILFDRHQLPLDVRLETIARIKILAGLRSDEHQAAQDGRFRYHGNEDIDIRVSVMPTYHGENAVLRLLGETGAKRTLADLGFSSKDADQLAVHARKNSGMILSTGPTGSGKTTTLYTLMGLIDTSKTSIVTIEDPIEYAVTGVRQIPVKERTGLTFAQGLRAVLRQDPDVIMVGEIRDTETARLAVNAALTGHLVMSSLHTTDAATAIPRLLDMESEPYLLASTLTLVIAQRLVRRVCTCAKEGSIAEELLTRLPEGSPKDGWCVPVGCDACAGTGYRGRMSIYEILRVDESIQEAIVERKAASNIRKLALKAGMVSIEDDGIAKASRGETTLEEVFRAIHD